MLFPMMTAVGLHLVLYASLQNIIIPGRILHIILFWKYLADIKKLRSEAWLNLFWEYVNGKLFAVRILTKKFSVEQFTVYCFCFIGFVIF
jgi:hypothetical protein